MQPQPSVQRSQYLGSGAARGHTASRQPKNSVEAGLDYGHLMVAGGELSFAVNARYQSRVLPALSTTVPIVPGFTMLDSRITYLHDHWMAAFYVDNVTNNLGILSYSDPAIYGYRAQAIVSQPRTFGLTLGYSFRGFRREPRGPPAVEGICHNVLMNSLEILERLVAFPTVSRDSNLPLIEYVRDFLAAHGIEVKLYPDVAGAKANLFASVGPSDRPGVLLSGHTDVVPVDGQPWSCDPFRLQERSGRLFARGAADMKGFLACALRAMELAASRSLQLPLQLAFSYDEELGCLGVHSLIQDMATWAHRPRFCIVGEPTMLRAGIAHKGKTAFRAVCHGEAAHSAAPKRGINAVYLACDLIGKLRQRQDDIEARGLRDPGYEVPYTTLHAGVIHGGTVLNIVPARCELELEFRNVPGDDPQGLTAALRADAAAVASAATAGSGQARIDLEVSFDYPAFDTAPDADVVELAASLTGHRERIKVGYGSEAGLFSRDAGVASVLCGPGSIDQAHKPDEFIDRDQMLRCDAMLDALLERLV